jgi:hypothetical protein
LFWKFFATWRQKKGVGEPKKGIFEILKTNSSYLDRKNLKVSRFRQCVLVGRQN